MRIEEFNDRLVYCNPYTNPLGWASHFWGDYTPNKYDSIFVDLYEQNKNRQNNQDNFKYFWNPFELTLGLAYQGGKAVVNSKEEIKEQKIPQNLTTEERKEYILHALRPANDRSCRPGRFFL